MQVANNLKENTIYYPTPEQIKKIRKENKEKYLASYLKNRSLEFTDKLLSIVWSEIKDNSGMFCKTCLKSRIQELVREYLEVGEYESK